MAGGVLRGGVGLEFLEFVKYALPVFRLGCAYRVALLWCSWVGL